MGPVSLRHCGRRPHANQALPLATIKTSPASHQKRDIRRLSEYSCAKSLALLLSTVLVLLSSEGCGTKTASAAAPPPPNVQVVAVAQQNVPIYHEYIATLDGYVNAVIQPQVSGT